MISISWYPRVANDLFLVEWASGKFEIFLDSVSMACACIHPVTHLDQDPPSTFLQSLSEQFREQIMQDLDVNDSIIYWPIRVFIEQKTGDCNNIVAMNSYAKIIRINAKYRSINTDWLDFRDTKSLRSKLNWHCKRKEMRLRTVRRMLIVWASSLYV